LQTREDFQKLHDEASGEALNYEERLVRADVATLSRAERRARARTIMKQKRRVTPAAQQPRQVVVEQDEGDDEGQVGQAMPLLQQDAQQHEVGHQDDDGHDDGDHSLNHHHQQQHASRKERQRLAKLAEKEERRACVQERRQQQEQAQQVARHEKRERERLQAMRSEEERTMQKQQQQAQEQQRRVAWNTFLSSPKRAAMTLSVEEWINSIELKQQRTVNIDELAESFDLSTQHVKERIHELIRQRRVAGVFIISTTDMVASESSESESELFVYFSDRDLQDLAKEIEKRGSITPAEMADLCNTIIFAAAAAAEG
jgi:DDRGK domain